jgi:hypothetical protein
MRWIKYILAAVMPVLAMLFFAPSGILAADDGVLPHTFSAGTPAKASEVNENFGFVNHGNIVLIDGTGAELGTFIGSGPYDIWYMNNNGYIANIGELVPNSEINNIGILGYTLAYTTSDCTGTVYIPDLNPGHPMIPGRLFSNNGSLYYLPKNAGSPIYMTYNSSRDSSNSTCVQPIPPNQWINYLYQVFINDPSVTGESSIIKTPPLRIIRRTK